MTGSTVCLSSYSQGFNFARWVISHFYCCLPTFFQSLLFQKLLSGTIRASNHLDQDQDQYFVGPDLSPNCLHLVISRRQKMSPSKKECMFIHILPLVSKSNALPEFVKATMSDPLGFFPLGCHDGTSSPKLGA